MVSIRGSACVFDLVYAGAQRVYVSGDFDHGSAVTVEMESDGRGLWRTALSLPAGTYRFRYFADGQWLNDYAAFGLERNAEGQWDSVLVVPESEVGEEVGMRRLAPPRLIDPSGHRRDNFHRAASSAPRRR